MDISKIQSGQKWKLINIVNRPDIVIQNVDKYNDIIYWHYENDKQINESKSDYFLKTFKCMG